MSVGGATGIGFDPSRSGFPTFDPRSSPSRLTSSHSPSRRVDTKPTTRPSSTRWPTTSELGERIGQSSDDDLIRLTRALVVFLGLAGI
jgi:hypothetical protein